MKDFFCPNCGQKLRAGTKFCPNCGTNVSKVTSELEENGNSHQNSTESASQQQATEPNKQQETAPRAQAQVRTQHRSENTASLDKRVGNTNGTFSEKWNENKKRNNTILLVVILIIIFLIWGHFYYSVDNQMNRALNAIGDPGANAGKYVTSTTSKVTINNDTVKPIQKYFQKYPGDFEDMKKDFNNGNKWEDYSFVPDGRAFLIWQRYKIQAEPSYITVNTDQKNMDIKMDGQELGKVNSNNDTSDTDTNENNTTQGTYSRSFGPYLPGLHKFVGTKTVNGHTIKTTLNSSDDSITINNGISNDLAQSLLSSVFTHNVDDLDEDFVGGQNNDGYKQLVKMFDGFQDDDDIESYDATVNVNSVSPLSNSKYKVNYQVKFTFENKDGDDDDSSTSKRIQVFKYSGIIVKTNDQNNSNSGFKIQSLGHAKKVSESNEKNND